MGEQLSVTRQVELSGGPMVPLLAATIYGAWRLFRVGFHGAHATIPYILVAGGVASILAIAPYVSVSFSPPVRSWRSAAASASVFVPYAYALFVIGYLGIWGAWQAITMHFGMWHILFAAIWFLAGWSVLFALAKIQQLARQTPINIRG